MNEETHIGIDVSKAHLFVCVLPSGQARRNKSTDLNALTAWLEPLQATRIICEATGGYERDLVAAHVAAAINDT